jgi:hypothetical protein
MAYYIDNAIAVRIIYLLVTPFDQWEAYKKGIIDADGKVINQPTTGDDDWTMLHRLVARLKKMLAKIPGGSSKIASYAAAYLLVREAMESNKEYSNLEEIYERMITASYDDPLLEQIKVIIEDAPVNVAGNVATVEKPLLKRVKRRAISNATKKLEVVDNPSSSS